MFVWQNKGRFILQIHSRAQVSTEYNLLWNTRRNGLISSSVSLEKSRMQGTRPCPAGLDSVVLWRPSFQLLLILSSQNLIRLHDGLQIIICMHDWSCMHHVTAHYSAVRIFGHTCQSAQNLTWIYPRPLRFSTLSADEVWSAFSFRVFHPLSPSAAKWSSVRLWCRLRSSHQRKGKNGEAASSQESESEDKPDLNRNLGSRKDRWMRSWFCHHSKSGITDRVKVLSWRVTRALPRTVGVSRGRDYWHPPDWRQACPHCRTRSLRGATGPKRWHYWAASGHGSIWWPKPAPLSHQQHHLIIKAQILLLSSRYNGIYQSVLSLRPNHNYAHLGWETGVEIRR